jgi:hypothetical protein
MDSAAITDITAMSDKVFLTGYFSNPSLRMQNCTFDSATVLEGPPANTRPTTVFECAIIGSDPPTGTPNSASKTEFAISGSTSTDVSTGTFVSNTLSSISLFTAAYNGSGSLAWLRTASEGAIRPRAIASLQPALGGKALQGPWGGGVGDQSVAGRNQASCLPPQNPNASLLLSLSPLSCPPARCAFAVPQSYDLPCTQLSSLAKNRAALLIDKQCAWSRELG